MNPVCVFRARVRATGVCVVMRIIIRSARNTRERLRELLDDSEKIDQLYDVAMVVVPQV